MAVVRKKQDDKNLKVLREIVSLNGNKQCFDCGQRGPTYVNMTIGSFVCTRCSGILRGLTPPHRVKSISMATFTTEEIDFIRSHGNEDCAKTWMGLWDPKRTTTQDHRELLVDKYERKRYYLEPASPLKSINTTSQQQQQITNNTTTNNHNSNNNNSDNIAALKAINLTPPSTLPLFKNNSVHHQQFLQQQHLAQKQNQTTINNNNNVTSNFQQQFTPDDSNSLFNQQQQQQQQQIRLNNNNNSNQINNNNINGLNRNGLNINNKTMVTTTNGEHHNKFTPDSDFIADFSSANIFNSSNNINNNNNNNHHNNINNSNNSIDKNKLISNSNRPRQNGLSTSSLPTSNGTTNTTALDENFADFEHNVIYNAGGLPMSLSSTSNSLNSSGTFTSNSSLNSTPSADRYAALKDLDEQIREHKEKEKMEQAVFNTTTTVTANPFKTASNPFQQQQPQPQQQQQHTQVQNSWPQHEQVFGMNTTSLFNQSATTKPDQFNQHFVAQQQLQQQHIQQNFIPNGFGGPSPFTPVVGGYTQAAATQNHLGMINGYNGGMVAQTSMSNPFQSSVTSNNPFL